MRLELNGNTVMVLTAKFTIAGISNENNQIKKLCFPAENIPQCHYVLHVDIVFYSGYIQWHSGCQGRNRTEGAAPVLFQLWVSWAPGDAGGALNWGHPPLGKNPAPGKTPQQELFPCPQP